MSSNPFRELKPRVTSRMARAMVLAFAALVSACQTPGPLPELSPASAIDALGGRVAADSPDDAPDPDQLSMAEAIRLALRRSPALQEAFARFDEAVADARQARRLPNPTLELALRVDGLFSGLEGDASLISDLVATLTREGRAGISDERLRAACLEVVARALDEIDAVREAYIRVQAAEAAMPLLREEAATLGRLHDVADQRRSAGEAPGSDVDALDAERSAIEDKLRDAEREAKAARIDLARRIARPESVAVWTIDLLPEPTDDLGDLATWTRQALELRPELVAADHETAALESEAALVGQPVLGVLEAGPTIEHQDGTSAGLAGSVTLPIFDDGEQRHAAAKARADAARDHAAGLRLDVAAEVRASWFETEAAREQIIHLDRDRLPALERRSVAVRAAFDVGEADLTESLVAERDLIEAHTRRIELLHTFHDARRRLERAAGGVEITVVEPALELRATEEGVVQ